MAQFTIERPDDKVQELLTAFATLYPIPQAVTEEGEEEEPQFTKPQWAKKKVRDYIREIYTAWKAKEAAEVARLAAIGAADEYSEDWSVT